MPPAQVKGDQNKGSSKAGLSIKIHTSVDVLGNPTGFTFSSGPTRDLQGAEVLLTQIAADTLIAEKPLMCMSGSLAREISILFNIYNQWP